MKLWLLKQDEVSGYDTFDSCVVAAETEELAKKTLPSDYMSWEYPAVWATSPDTVTAIYLGESADPDPGVICASFNAG